MLRGNDHKLGLYIYICSTTMRSGTKHTLILIARCGVACWTLVTSNTPGISGTRCAVERHAPHTIIPVAICFSNHLKIFIL